MDNDVAWFLATCPDPKVRDPKKAVELAREVVRTWRAAGPAWNTLGAALYRAGDWKGAISALEKSMELRKGGDADDWFFLAMAHWQRGDKEQARKWFGQAVQWMDKHKPHDEELRRFRAEAAALLKIEDTSSRKKDVRKR
jgi:tetratricopeptide (TPR) repeat protein